MEQKYQKSANVDTVASGNSHQTWRNNIAAFKRKINYFCFI